MTYYNQYKQMEFGIFPHQGNLMDLMWQRSSIKYVAQVHTPVVLMHGENDADVPIAKAEQFYIGPKDSRRSNGLRALSARRPRNARAQACGGHDRPFDPVVSEAFWAAERDAIERRTVKGVAIR
jgi:hypothetical protein